MRKNNTIIAEALYKAMVSEMQREKEEYTINLDFSPEFEKKMQKLIKKRKKSYYPFFCTAGRRAACIGTAALVACGAAMSAEAVREKVTGFIIKHFQGHDIVSTEPYSQEYIPEAIEQEYIIELPEGFVLNKENVVRSSKTIQLDYCKNDIYIHFRQDTLDNEYEGIIDNETIKKECYIDEHGTSYTIYCEENWLNVILWKCNGYLFRVVSNLEKGLALEMCMNLKPVSNLTGGYDKYPRTMEQEYIIDVPDGFIFDNNHYLKAANMVCISYRNGDNYIFFDQQTVDDFSIAIDNESNKTEFYTDENGIEYTIYYEPNCSANVLWKRYGYIFTINSNLDKEQVIDICRSLKPKS